MLWFSGRFILQFWTSRRISYLVIIRWSLSKKNCFDISGLRCEVSSRSQCPPNWVRWIDKCYYVGKDKSLFKNQANRACLDMGAQLVSIESQVIFLFLFKWRPEYHSILMNQHFFLFFTTLKNENSEMEINNYQL